MISLMRTPLYCRTARNPIKPTREDAYAMEQFENRADAERALRQVDELAERLGDPPHYFLD